MGQLADLARISTSPIDFTAGLSSNDRKVRSPRDGYCQPLRASSFLADLKLRFQEGRQFGTVSEVCPLDTRSPFWSAHTRGYNLLFLVRNQFGWY